MQFEQATQVAIRMVGMSERGITLQEVILRAVEGGLRDVYTWVPAKVVKYDATKQKVDCQILIKNVTTGEEDDREVASWPVVTAVPVEFFGAGGFRLTCPISDGNLVIDGEQLPATTGSLVFSHRSLDKWLSGSGKEVDPEVDHSHALADAKFTPGIRPFGSPWSSCPTDKATIGHDSGVQVHMHKNTMCLGSSETNAEQMFLAETLIADLKAAVTTINTILLAGTTGGPTAQNIVQAAQWALTNLYIRLQADGVAYLSQEILNK